MNRSASLMNDSVLRIVVDSPSIGTNPQAERLFQYYQNPLFHFQTMKSANIETELPSFDRFNNSILLTENERLLEKRVRLKGVYPHITMVGSSECMEIMDLYAKKMDKCFLSPIYPVSRSTWYLVQSGSAFHYFDFPNSRDTAATRFMCLLKALDYMGILFYSPVNDDTQEDTTYHFNYFVILVSGVFDILAILTKNHLKLSFDRDDIPSRTSLSNDNGKDFLSAIKGVNLDLWNHITAYRSYIELVYAFRDQLIHRETIPTAPLNYSGGMERSDLAIIDVQGEIVMRLKELRGFEKDLRNSPMTNWGVYAGFGSVAGNPKSLWISPYVLAKAAMKNLIAFTNEYMRLLGLPDSLTSGRTGWPFDEVKAIRTTGLGLVNSWN